jgi:hypothetical protein
MNAIELVEYIFERKDKLPKAFLRDLESSPQFGDFTYVYRDKIRKKVRNAKYDDNVIKDILAEIELAYRLLQIDQFSVVYERYNTKEPHPDLTVTDNESGIVFNLEVKRIRCTGAEKRFDAWKEQVIGQIKEIPSLLAFSMDIGDFNTPICLLNRLEAEKEKVISYIREMIVNSQEEIPLGSERYYFVPGFEGEFEFRLRKPPRKPTSAHTSYYYTIAPDFATHKEYRKFGDVICNPEHLRQMRPDMTNILAIISDSAIHEDFDLDASLGQLYELAREEDEFFIKKGFKGSKDYEAQIERVSAILLLSASVPVHSAPNALWCNNKAKYSIPKDLVKILASIALPKAVIVNETVKE